MIKRSIEDIYKAIDAQKQYTERTKVPHFAPTSGRCFACGRDIYQAYSINGRESRGIDLKRASEELITGCPHCHRSYCD